MNCGVSCRFSGTSCFFVIGCLQFLPITDADNTPTRIYADEEQRRLRTHGCGADAVGALSWRQTVVRPLREKPADTLNSHARNIPYLTNPTNELIDQISHEALNGMSCGAACRGWQLPCFPTDSLSSLTVNHPALFIVCANLPLSFRISQFALLPSITMFLVVVLSCNPRWTSILHFAMATVCAMMRGLIKEVLSAVVPNPDKIVVVPTGVDSEFFQPMDTGDCKTELASAFQNEAIRHLPLVLLFLLSLSLENQAFVEKLY